LKYNTKRKVRAAAAAAAASECVLMAPLELRASCLHTGPRALQTVYLSVKPGVKMNHRTETGKKKAET